MLAAVLDRQRGTLLLWVPATFGAGIAGYFALRTEPGLAPLAAAAAAGAGLVALAWRRPLARAVAVLLLFAALGLLAAKLRAERVAAPVLRYEVHGAVVGRLVGIDRSERNQLRLMLDRVMLPEHPDIAPPARVRIVLAQEPPAGLLFAGAQVMLRARLGPPPPPVEPDGFDFRRYAWFAGLGAIGYAADPMVLATPRAPPEPALRLLDLRLRLAEAIRAEMPGRAGGFAAAILTGDRSGVDPADLVDLRASNLAHLLAISGLHMGLLCGAVFAAVRLMLILLPRVGLRWPAKKLAAVAAVAAGAGYLALSGASVPTQRAFVMAAAVFLAVLLDRPALTLRGVALAALVVLALMPEALMSPGFQMSFAATVALIACYGAVKDWAFWRGAGGPGGAALKAVAGLVLTALVAGLATAPFAGYHFNQVTRYGLIANVLAVPAMGLLVMPTGLLALVLWPLGLEGAGLALMRLGIEHILAVSHWAASLDGAVRPVPTGPPWVPGAVAVGGIALAALRGPVRLAGVLPVAAALGAWALAERPLILVAPEGRLVGVMGAEGRVLTLARGQGFVARVWLENDGDPAEQAAAAARAGPDLVTLWKEGRLPAGSCAAGRLVVAPGIASRPAGGCAFLGKAELATGGAYAFYAGKLDAPRSTRAATGSRPWTDAR